MFSTSVPPRSVTYKVLVALVPLAAFVVVIFTSHLTNKAPDHHVDRPAQGEVISLASGI